MTPTETRARRERDKLTRETGPEGVMRQITDYLTAEGIPFFRMNAGEAMVDGRRIKLHPKGTADLLAIVPEGRPFFWDWHGVDEKGQVSIHAVPFFIEVKRPYRGTVSDNQTDFYGTMIQHGCVACFASDVRDVMRILPPRYKREKAI